MGEAKLCNSNKMVYGVRGTKLYFMAECICNIMFKDQIKKSECLCAKKLQEFIWNQIYG